MCGVKLKAHYFVCKWRVYQTYEYYESFSLLRRIIQMLEKLKERCIVLKFNIICIYGTLSNSLH